jgi:hypothetical protein
MDSNDKNTLTKRKRLLSLAFAILFLVALPLTILASQLTNDTRSRASQRTYPTKIIEADTYKPSVTQAPVPSIITWKSDKISLTTSDIFVVFNNTIYHPSLTTKFEVGPTSVQKGSPYTQYSFDIYWNENSSQVKATVIVGLADKDMKFSGFNFYPTANITTKSVSFNPSTSGDFAFNPTSRQLVISSITAGSTNIANFVSGVPRGYLSFSNLNISLVATPSLTVTLKPTSIPTPTYIRRPTPTISKPQPLPSREVIDPTRGTRQTIQITQ